MMVSTDEFLKNRLGQKQNEQADFGKRLIAREILIAEKESEYPYTREPDGKKKEWCLMKVYKEIVVPKSFGIGFGENRNV